MFGVPTIYGNLSQLGQHRIQLGPSRSGCEGPNRRRASLNIAEPHAEIPQNMGYPQKAI